MQPVPAGTRSCRRRSKKPGAAGPAGGPGSIRSQGPGRARRAEAGRTADEVGEGRSVTRRRRKVATTQRAARARPIAKAWCHEDDPARRRTWSATGVPCTCERGRIVARRFPPSPVGNLLRRAGGGHYQTGLEEAVPQRLARDLGGPRPDALTRHQENRRRALKAIGIPLKPPSTVQRSGVFTRPLTKPDRSNLLGT